MNAWGRRFLINRPTILSREPSTSCDDVDAPPITRNTSQGPRPVLPSELHAFSIDRFQALGGFDGLLSHSLDCCECGHIFDVQLNPFTSLMLPIPNVHMDGRAFMVDEDICLEACLRDFFSTKRQGPILCPKCSFQCTVSSETKTEVMPVKKESVIRGSACSSLDVSSVEEDINNCGSSRKSSGLSDILVETKGRMTSIGGVVYRSHASFDLKEFQNNSLRPSMPSVGTKTAVVKDVTTAARTSPFHDAHVKNFREKLHKVGIPWIKSESHVYAKTAIAKSPKVRKSPKESAWIKFSGLGNFVAT